MFQCIICICGYVMFSKLICGIAYSCILIFLHLIMNSHRRSIAFYYAFFSTPLLSQRKRKRKKSGQKAKKSGNRIMKLFLTRNYTDAEGKIWIQKTTESRWKTGNRKQETGNGKQETGNRKQKLKKFKEEKHSNSQRGPYNCASSASMLLNLIYEIF